MKPSSILLIACLFACNLYTAEAQQGAERSLIYLNQETPGTIPKPFAPGIVPKTKAFEFGSVFSQDGKDFFML